MFYQFSCLFSNFYDLKRDCNIKFAFCFTLKTITVTCSSIKMHELIHKIIKLVAKNGPLGWNGLIKVYLRSWFFLFFRNKEKFKRSWVQWFVFSFQLFDLTSSVKFLATPTGTSSNGGTTGGVSSFLNATFFKQINYNAINRTKDQIKKQSRIINRKMKYAKFFFNILITML